MSGQLSFREKLAQRRYGVMTPENVASALGQILAKIEVILRFAGSRGELCFGRTSGKPGRQGFKQYQGLEEIIEEVDMLKEKLIETEMETIEMEIRKMHNKLVFLYTIMDTYPLKPNPYKASPEKITNFIFGEISRITGTRHDGLLGHATIELIKRNRSSVENRTHSTKDNQEKLADMFAELEEAHFRGGHDDDQTSRHPGEFSQGGSYEVGDDEEEMIQISLPPEFNVSDDEFDEFRRRNSRSPEFPGRGWE